MDTIYLRVSTLEKLVQDLKSLHLDAVSLCMAEIDPDDPDLPAALFVSGLNSSSPEMEIDMDDLVSDDAVARLFLG